MKTNEERYYFPQMQFFKWDITTFIFWDGNINVIKNSAEIWRNGTVLTPSDSFVNSPGWWSWTFKWVPSPAAYAIAGNLLEVRRAIAVPAVREPEVQHVRHGPAEVEAWANREQDEKH